MTFLDTVRSIFHNTPMDITGNWTGIYGYGESYSEHVRQKKVNFAANLERQGANHAFTGTITDLDGGIVEPASIAGEIRGKRIRFTKTYPSSYQIDRQGVTTKESHGPMHVMYKGSYDEATQVVRGEWQIEATYVFKNGKTMVHTSNGYWEMKRNNSL